MAFIKKGYDYYNNDELNNLYDELNSYIENLDYESDEEGDSSSEGFRGNKILRHFIITVSVVAFLSIICMVIVGLLFDGFIRQIFMPKAVFSTLASLLQVGLIVHKLHQPPPLDDQGDFTIISKPQEAMSSIISALQYIYLCFSLLFMYELYHCICKVKVKTNIQESLLKKSILAVILPLALVGAQYLVRFYTASRDMGDILMVFTTGTPVKVLLYALSAAYICFAMVKIILSLKKAQDFRGQNSSAQSNKRAGGVIGLVTIVAITHILQMCFLIFVITLTSIGVQNASKGINCIHTAYRDQNYMMCFALQLDWDAITTVGLSYLGLVEFSYILCKMLLFFYSFMVIRCTLTTTAGTD